MSQKYIRFEISGTCPIPEGAKMEDAFTLHQPMGMEHVEDAKIVVGILTVTFTPKQGTTPTKIILVNGVPSDIAINDITLSIEEE